MSTFETDMQTSLSKIKENLKAIHDLPAEEVQDAQGKAGTAKRSYRKSAKRIFPLVSKYQEKSKSLYGKGKVSEAEVQRSYHEKLVQNAESKTWVIKGRCVSRFQMMVHLIEEMGRGKTLSKMCAIVGYPSVQTVMTWKEEHPDFRKALDLAKKVQAQVFADEALDTMRDEMDPKAAALAKNKHDALMKRASLQSPDFRERQAAPPEEDKHDIKAMQDQLLALITADDSVLPPEVAKLIRDAIEGKPGGSLTISLAPED